MPLNPHNSVRRRRYARCHGDATECAECERCDRVIEERVAAAPPLTPADIERLRPIAAPLFKLAAEQLVERRRLNQRFAGLRPFGGAFADDDEGP
jgi:hypothetical protein